MIVRALLSFTAALSLAACSNAASTPSTPANSCSFAFSGNRTEAASTITSCGLLSTDVGAGAPDAGSSDASDAEIVDATASDADTADASSADDYYLIFRASSARIRAFASTVDLGPSPIAGQFSPESVSSWSATGVNDDGCNYLAGTDAVPSGNFTLTLTSIHSVAGRPTQAHGTLTLDASLKAPPQTDCGSGDIEALTVQF